MLDLQAIFKISTIRLIQEEWRPRRCALRLSFGLEENHVNHTDRNHQRATGNFNRTGAGRSLAMLTMKAICTCVLMINKLMSDNLLKNKYLTENFQTFSPRKTRKTRKKIKHLSNPISQEIYAKA